MISVLESPTVTSSWFHSSRHAFPELKTLFFAEFDTKVGPVITFQVPVDIITKDQFDSISAMIITKEELWNKLLKINLSDCKIMGYPVGIKSKHYFRNEFLFNMCFVVVESSDSDYVFEPLVTKLAHYLSSLELEERFLSRPETKARLPSIMAQIVEDINRSGCCSVDVNHKTAIYLKITPCSSDPPPPLNDHLVPVLVTPITSSIEFEQFDAVTRRILSLIDGYQHLDRIIQAIDIDPSLVKNTVQNLVVRGLIVLLPVFQYWNRYTVTNKIHQIYADPELQKECISFVTLKHSSPSNSAPPAPVFSDIFRLYCGLRPGIAMKDWCLRQNPTSSGVDERKLVQYGLIKKVIRKLTAYPIWTGSGEGQTQLEFSCNGSLSIEELCCKFRMKPSALFESLEANNNVTIIWK